jgi:hypothetical protein
LGGDKSHGEIPDRRADFASQCAAFTWSFPTKAEFGKFAVLSASEEAFIQAGNDRQPREECSELEW